MSDKDYIKTLEDSNKNLNDEIDRLRRMLSAHGINPDKELDKVTDEAYSSGYEDHYNKYINYQIQGERNRTKNLQEQLTKDLKKEIDRQIVSDIWKLANSTPSMTTYTPIDENTEF